MGSGAALSSFAIRWVELHCSRANAPRIPYFPLYLRPSIRLFRLWFHHLCIGEKFSVRFLRTFVWFGSHHQGPGGTLSSEHTAHQRCQNVRDKNGWIDQNSGKREIKTCNVQKMSREIMMFRRSKYGKWNYNDYQALRNGLIFKNNLLNLNKNLFFIQNH